MNKRILVVGSANMDLSMNIARIPERGETMLDDGGVAYTPGGKGANAAVAFARLGATSYLSAKIGMDVHGQRLYKFYQEVGVDTSFIKVDRDNNTGFAVVMKEPNGDNRIVVYPGANSYLSIENINEAFSARPEAVYLNLEIPFTTAVQTARLATSRRVPVIIDAAPASKTHQLDLFGEVEIFTPNENEAFEYTGVMPLGTSSALQAAMMLYKRVRAKYIVIKQGERGAFVYNGKHHFIIPAMKAGKVVDTTAAGDTFGAAMTIEYLRTGDIREAVKFGVAAGAIAVSRPGASTSIPSEAEVRQLIARSEF